MTIVRIVYADHVGHMFPEQLGIRFVMGSRENSLKKILRQDTRWRERVSRVVTSDAGRLCFSKMLRAPEWTCLNDGESLQWIIIKLRHVLDIRKPVPKKRFGILAHLLVVTFLRTLVAFEATDAAVDVTILGALQYQTND